MTFGEIIAEARKERGLSQKELATLIKKEDGQSISAPYLNDIEHDRRSPSSDHLIEQFAVALEVEPEVLYFASRRIPLVVYTASADKKRILAAFRAMRRELERGTAAT